MTGLRLSLTPSPGLRAREDPRQATNPPARVDANVDASPGQTSTQTYQLS